ncbi:hypothetical protein CLAFUW4_13086 [Fulvia fulva]|uniref:Uncharacterized protein n=1 Tax=Passalora fulva TaxID=5499 RepID=A0A9Q8UV37_PASFU|nr:uncharacterized protein CLAFUR5_12944 [Fulvia fulva]KAK4611776.1 hypothetical protein CLAFUR4_13090 [Fulvia fulva]KAK4613180.1 hypothetical protein CLAFUR0_13094 [Fulvia fulva]UJO23573.1 hypothetical protein CLAFUR5_12944 [Fulvia fulva]WPV21235.1 hypothetical protein CLAFUW4_13086 [Fulvia fulva]WPV36095.1 hypothetical protein CLAFUW7_13093 [Fulvia fulva]
MGNKLSTEEPQHVKALKLKPNVLKEPAFQHYTAGWREAEFDDDAEEFFFKQPPDYDSGNEKEGTTNYRYDGHAREDDAQDLQIQPGRLEDRSSPHQDRARKERRPFPSEGRCTPMKASETASDRCNRCRPTADAGQQEDILRQEDTSARKASCETAGV